MRTPDDVAERLRQTWRRRWTEWLGGVGDWPLAVTLDAPTEAKAISSFARFTAWVSSWRDYAGPGRVRWESRTWSRLGAQDVPTHLEFVSAKDAAITIDASTAALFDRCDARFRDRLARWPEAGETLRAHAPWLQGLSEEDYDRTARVLDWLEAHPDCQLYPRQLPIEGVDTKWIEGHGRAIAALLAARRGVPAAPLRVLAGFKIDPPRRRLRLLDARMRARFGGLSDLTAR